MADIVRGFVPKINSQITPVHLKDTAYAYNVKRDALLMSAAHRRKGRNGWDGGGPFYAVKQHIETIPTEPMTFVRNSVKWQGATSYGALTSPPTSIDAAVGTMPFWQDEVPRLTSWGSTGWKRARPDKPIGSLAQFVYELNDLPSIPLRLYNRLKSFNSLGSEYLNIQFGWRPFVNDLVKFYELQQTLERRLNQLRRDNGQNIRRKLKLKESTNVTVNSSSTSSIIANGCWPAPPNWASGQTYLTDFTSVQEKVWYSASMKYWIPEPYINSVRWTRRAKLALFGALPTPEVVLAVLPWSWLINWFSNIADVTAVASMGAVDALSANYAFVMRQVTTLNMRGAVITVKPSIYSNDKWDGGQFVTFTRRTTTTKSRMGASPFGFGVKFESLSAFQTSIAVALGISRLRF